MVRQNSSTLAEDLNTRPRVGRMGKKGMANPGTISMRSVMQAT
jgi:hypothetical protein